MLKLENIKKTYVMGDNVVRALKGVSVEFRKSEFVAILGPSGCGKTTMLNIIGGLDRYDKPEKKKKNRNNDEIQDLYTGEAQETGGDLIIKGRSTKEFKDRDWDTYRNHSVGFVFQSYNLIPHQTALGNVELALTIAGMSKAERVAKAKAAMDKVGLSDQYKKRPNQMSGGQMQRIAIARALVNDPEIVLADEPTGALDTETSKQIMDLMREIAKDRLVVMVTHNPELAKEYSTRIIRLLDGNLIADSNPYDGKDSTYPASEINQKTAKDYAPIQTKDALECNEKGRYKKRTKMSFLTAFRLSLQNLISKRKRSIMVTVAGSIGIIGVSLVLAFSFGVQGFITHMQSDMLSGNPITVEQTAFDINAMMTNMGHNERAKVTFKDGFANVTSTVEEIKKRMDSMRNLMVENTITDDYIKFLEDMPNNYLAALHFDYGLDLKPSLYTSYRDNNSCNHVSCAKTEAECINERHLSLSTIRALYGSILENTELAEYSNLINRLGNSFRQLPGDAEDYILSQYNLVQGNKVASGKNEIMLVLGEDRRVADLLLAQLGYYSQQEFLNIVYRATASEDNNQNKDKIDETIQDRGDKISYVDLIGKTFMWYENDDIFIKNTAKNMTAPMDTGGVGSIKLPLDYEFDYLEDASKIDTDADGIELTIVGILEPKKNMSFGMLSNGFYYTTNLAEHIISRNTDSLIVEFSRAWEAIDWEDINGTWDTAILGQRTYNNTIPGIPFPVPVDKADGLILYYYTYDYWWEGSKETEDTTGVAFLTPPRTGMFAMFSGFMGGGASVQTLGGSQIPTYIGIYPANLKIKTQVLKYLDRWNTKEDIVLVNAHKGHVIPATYADGYEREDIMYSDMLSLIFDMIRTMVNLITIALVSFTSLALIVSSVMIGIITYVSVVERIKEIGVIRSLGGRKRDVSNLFTAETFILGLSAGVFGIAFTYIASWIISAIVKSLAGIASIAFLPIGTAIIMITLSVVLTSISGLMPSRSAAKKDPVIALRTE